MFTTNDIASDCDLGEWRDEIDDDGPTYRCPSCGCVGKARCWAWYGWSLRPLGREPQERECRYCALPLTEDHEIDGYPCGDCGKDVVEVGTDYCKSCNAAHDAVEAADPLHHHVWQSASDFEATVREITREQVRL